MSASPRAGQEVRDRVQELRSRIQHHDWRYYVLQDPEIADGEYDKLFKELQQLEERHPELVTTDSPTQRVGGEPVEGFAEARHDPPLLSLENGYEEQEIRDWHERLLNHLKVEELPCNLVAEPKLDGVSCKVVYRDGHFEIGATRGNGEVGEDVSSNARTIRSLPLVLREPAPDYLDVRGEVIVGLKEFAKLNQTMQEQGEKPFANPRNLTSGALRQVDPRETATRPLDIYVYTIGRVDGVELPSHSAALQWMEEHGLPTLWKHTCVGDLDAVIDHYHTLLEKRDEFPVEMDGMVLKVDDLAVQERLGFRSRSPRWAIAFKFPARQATTRLEAIHVQVGRNGTLTPVAQLEAVALSGVTITSATLHNRDEIERLGVKVGDTVLIERAGDVIPKVIKVIESKRDGSEQDFKFPEQCPICGTDAISEEDQVAIRCPNLRCPARVRKQIEHFVGRNAMDIEGLGDKLVDQLVDRRLVGSPADLYGLTVETLVELERMGEKSANNLIEQIERSRTRPLSSFLFALGIPFIGQTVAEAIAVHVKDLDTLRNTDPEELHDIHGVGPKASEAWAEFQDSEDGAALLDELAAAGVRPSAVEAAPDSGPLEGKTFLFTGALSVFSRDQAAALVKARGGRVLSGVSKKLDYLVVGEKPGSKLKKAQDLGIEVLTEEEFRERIED